MRKILAAFLAVMMLVGVLAAMPVSAEATKSTFDGTTSDEKIDLVVTEVLINSKTGQESLDNVTASGSVSVYSSPDAFDYIEIYNRGTTAVNLFDYVILSANSKDFTATSMTGLNNAKYIFTHQNTIVTGSIHDDNNASGAASGSKTEYNQCENPTDRNKGILEPGKIAVIWFWTSDTDKLCNQLTESVGAMHEGDTRYFPYFRNYYNLDDDVLVLATNAKASVPTGTNSADVFNSLANGYTYALAKGGTSGFKFGEKAVKDTGGGLVLDPSIVTMFEYATNTAVGIPTTDNMDDMSAYYLPANCAPDLYNANAKNLLSTDEEKAAYVNKPDYYSINYTRSYRECSVVTYTEQPTPGAMPSWQWMYLNTTGSTGLSAVEARLFARAEAQAQAMVDASEIEATAKDAKTAELFDALMSKYVTDWKDAGIKDATTGRLLAEAGENGWLAVAKAKFLADYVAELVEEEDNAETKKNYAEGFVDRAVLEERHNQKKTSKNEKEGGLPIWALILIIVGGVVVAAGVAVVVILVLKKKKAVAPDDVPTEFVPVVDETAGATDDLPGATDVPADVPTDVTDAPAPVDDDKQ